MSAVYQQLAALQTAARHLLVQGMKHFPQSHRNLRRQLAALRIERRAICLRHGFFRAQGAARRLANHGGLGARRRRPKAHQQLAAHPSLASQPAEGFEQVLAVLPDEIDHLLLRSEKCAEAHRQHRPVLKNTRDDLAVFHDGTRREGEVPLQPADQHRVPVATERKDRAPVDAAQGRQCFLGSQAEQTIRIDCHGGYPVVTCVARAANTRAGLRHAALRTRFSRMEYLRMDRVESLLPNSSHRWGGTAMLSSRSRSGWPCLALAMRRDAGARAATLGNPVKLTSCQLCFDRQNSPGRDSTLYHTTRGRLAGPHIRLRQAI